MKRWSIGFIIDSCLPTLKACLNRKCSPGAMIRGWEQRSAIGIIRYQWLAEHVNRNPKYGLHYDIYKPWKKYDAIVFLKSMGDACSELMNRYNQKGRTTIFDLNVDYLSEPEGTFYYDGMAPSALQIAAAREMVTGCSGVIADSRHLLGIARKHNRNAQWIPDHVKTDLIQDFSHWKPDNNSPLRLLWSGEAVKLFDLLRINNTLCKFRSHIHLVIITNSLDPINRWKTSVRNDFQRLLNKVSHEIIPFSTVEKLLAFYENGGIFISPRFLDNNYNLGHTEWKITLAMARSRPVLCSPQPSYIDVAQFALNSGIKICEKDESWEKALDEMLSLDYPWIREQKRAVDVVRKEYSTHIIAERHARFIRKLIEKKDGLS